MTVTIHVAGAQPEDIVRGLLAAQAVFDRAGVTPDLAATARFVVEGWDIRGFARKVPEEELAICTLWDEADLAAVQARSPSSSTIGIRTTDRGAAAAI